MNVYMDDWTYNILTNVAYGFQGWLFHHFCTTWIGDIFCQVIDQVGP